MKLQITECLDLDLPSEQWVCNRCGHVLGPARQSYKKFTLVAERDPREVHNPYTQPGEFNYSLAPDPEWCRLLEFYCPNCAVLFEVEYLPPGYPITHDIELDLDELKRRHPAHQQERPAWEQQ